MKTTSIKATERERVPSYKERYFEQQGNKFLTESGFGDLFEETKKLVGYEDVKRSLELAINTRLLLMPKGLCPMSAQEREEFEIFYLRLRFDPLCDTFSKHPHLTAKYSANPHFLSSVADTIKRRLSQDNSPLSLEYYVLCGWLHSFLWLLLNEDRALLLGRIYDVTQASADCIRKTVRKLGLKDYADFQPKGTPAPLVVQLFNEGGQQWCQILPFSNGQV